MKKESSIPLVVPVSYVIEEIRSPQDDYTSDLTPENNS